MTTEEIAAIRTIITCNGSGNVNTNLHSGWCRAQSGPCCPACEVRPEHLVDWNPLLLGVGCRNPFQLASVCECHIAPRQAVVNRVQETLAVFDAFAAGVPLLQAFHPFHQEKAKRASTPNPSEAA